MWQSYAHAGFSVFLMLNYFILRHFLKTKFKKFDVDAVTPSDFTVWVKGLNSNYNPKELIKHFETKALGKNKPTEVSCISVVYDIGFYVKQVRKLKELKDTLFYIQDYRNRYKKNPGMSCCPKHSYSTAKLNREIKAIEIWLNDFEVIHKRSFSASRSAFITFKHQSVAKKVLYRWKRSLFDQLVLFLFYPIRCFCCCWYSSKKFKGKIIRVEEAPEPSDLKWENLSAGSFTKFFRRLQTIVVTFVLFIIVCFILFEIKSYQYELYQKLNKKENEETTISENNLMKVKSFSFLMSFIILVMGRIVAITIRILSDYEKHVSWTGYHKAVANKLIASSILNSIVVLLLVNLITFEYLPISFPGISNSDHIAFYESYGISNDLFYLLCTNAVISPITCILSPIYISKLCKRRAIDSQARNGIISLTQVEANEIWENPPIDMGQRYTNFMKTYLIILIMSPIFPLGMPIGFISMILQYWTDKYLLLRRHCKPPNLGKGLSNNLMNWLSLAIIFYAVLSK